MSGQIYIPTKRPLWVPAAFAGAARCFPKEDAFMLGHQRDWIEDESLEKIQEKSRRVGISYATSYERVRNHSKKTTTLASWVSSRDEMTARIFVQDCFKFAKIMNTAAKDMGAAIMEDENRRAHSVHMIAFNNGTVINSLASNPDVFAGKGGDVVNDELALRNDPEYVLGISLSTTDWGGRMANISTHRGSQNAFAKRCEKIRDGREPMNGMMRGRGEMAHATLHRTTLEYALQCGFLFKLQSKLKANDPRLAMDEQGYFDYIKGRTPNKEIFLQEYCCIPEDDAAAFLSYGEIDACQYALNEPWQVLNEGGRHTIGIDIGRDHDLTVMWVLEWVGTTAFTREIVELKAMPFSAQESSLFALMDRYKPVRVCIDQNGIGRQFTERAQEKYGKGCVEGVKFTQQSKEIMAIPYKGAFEDRRIRIPRGNEFLIADLRAIRKETTISGNTRFAADRGTNGHADRFWAGALSWHAGLSVTEIGQFKAALGSKATRRNQQRRRQIG